jgi:hypothetical protein
MRASQNALSLKGFEKLPDVESKVNLNPVF